MVRGVAGDGAAKLLHGHTTANGGLGRGIRHIRTPLRFAAGGRAR